MIRTVSFAALALSLAACSGSSPAPDAPATPTPTATATPSPQVLTLAGLGDLRFGQPVAADSHWKLGTDETSPVAGSRPRPTIPASMRS